VPEDLDPYHRVFIRHLWTSAYATANGTATFTTLYKVIAEGAALVSVPFDRDDPGRIPLQDLRVDVERLLPEVIASATAVGYRRARRFFAIELPLSVPVLAAGVRVASVSNISLVSVGALIGTGGLGVLFTDGFQREYFAPITVGIVLTLLLALIVDLLLVGLLRAATPWRSASRSVTPGDEVTAT
jgi:hypothetical protein